EVAEPYRILVVADFPAGFSDEAARRLMRLAASGPRCGVHFLIATDDDRPLPREFSYGNLPAAVRLQWHSQRFRWEDPDFAPFPLELEAAPPPAIAESLLDQIGEATKLARRVEVPFEYIAPPEDQYWTGNCSSALHVPLGRAGAGGKQVLALGQGTSQHVVVAGKTGSGKSTLLHALITNVALSFSPDEVQLYLIDFKKGVEFKTYATHGLPHARVVAIESEREFGLSVLQRLDAEMRHRGELFRAAGVQDLAGFRKSGKPLPRILLVVDEFQEFFVEDDRLAQDAAGLLDRLVRQGRAFGLHVLLGSQTLGGAYSLARSTIDQMAIRIALQCSEADAQLILSVDNLAARMLTRPGEAIYNVANGLSDGNHIFQVVWLDEPKREGYLRKLRA
ncbi:MAG: FtsK/SpoIIIE domain-containing protein, partial [Candidatus Acidiferrum sp.]